MLSTPVIKTIKRPERAVTVLPFSLIELLVVVGVIAILAGMLMPALTSAKARAVETNMVNNVNQLNKANLMYYDSADPNQFLWNTGTKENLSVDFEPLLVDGFVPNMMEDTFRTVQISDDPVLSLMSMGFDATAFHSSGTGLLYINFMTQSVFGTDTKAAVAIFNADSLNYNIPEDTQYIIIGVGMNGQLDPGKPEDDFVYLKREYNSNIERWPNN